MNMDFLLVGPVSLIFFFSSYVLSLCVPRGYTYYKIGNLDNRIANPDQLLTQDVEKFSNSVVDLYSNISKVGYGLLVGS